MDQRNAVQCGIAVTDIAGLARFFNACRGLEVAALSDNLDLSALSVSADQYTLNMRALRINPALLADWLSAPTHIHLTPVYVCAD